MIKIGDKVKIDGTGSIWDGKTGIVDWIDSREQLLVGGGDATPVIVAVDFDTDRGHKIVRQQFNRENVKPLEDEIEPDDIHFDSESGDIEVDEKEPAEEALEEDIDNSNNDVDYLANNFIDKYTGNNYRQVFEDVLIACDRNESVALSVMGRLDEMLKDSKKQQVDFTPDDTYNNSMENKLHENLSEKDKEALVKRTKEYIKKHKELIDALAK